MDESVFLTEIDNEVASQEKTILKKAQDQVDQILRGARKEADHLERVLVHRTEAEIRKSQGFFLTQAELEKRRGELEVKSHFVARALEGAKTQFHALSQEAFLQVLKKLLRELFAQHDPEKPFVLRVKPEDEKIAQILCKDMAPSAEIAIDAWMSRGAELEDEKECCRLRNTFASRAEQVHSELVQRLNKTLFEGLHV
ncbi:MAG: V-type ATP synthase subunit E family protein [Candidatus Omnitrophota bacterium]